MTALLVILILVVLIVVHEFGHFLAAKIFRVKVDEFGVGYPPRAFLIGTFGGTEYTVNWIPFGGFVRLFGEDETARGRGSFVDAPRWKQAIILVAGVTANTILAWLLFASSYTLGIPVAIDTPNEGEKVQLFITDVVAGSPAAAANITAGDEIVSVSDKKGIRPSALTPNAVLDFIRVRGGQQIIVGYMHEKVILTAYVRPANAVVPGAAGRPAMGVGLALVATRSLSWPQALHQAIFVTAEVFQQVAQGLWTMVKESLGGTLNLNDVVGPVGLAKVVGEAAQNGLGNVLKLAGFISVNLAVINLIPIPALDGGRLFLLAIEAALRRDAPKLAVQVVNTLGIALIILLMVIVTYHDIAKLLV